MTKIPLLVSACLLGENCRYDAKAKPNPAVSALAEIFRFVPICPERDGGLPTPRPPCEIRDGKVVRHDGTDCTEAYTRGAHIAYQYAMRDRCRFALLKERSPSCGKGKIYDGTFSHNLTDGDGVTAAYLLQNGICVFGESEIEFLIKDALAAYGNE